MIIEVTVVPKSGRFSIQSKDNKLKVYLKSPPEDNKANLELLKGLKKALRCDIRIVAGQKSRHKKLEISLNKEAWESFCKGLE